MTRFYRVLFAQHPQHNSNQAAKGDSRPSWNGNADEAPNRFGAIAFSPEHGRPPVSQWQRVQNFFLGADAALEGVRIMDEVDLPQGYGQAGERGDTGQAAVYHLSLPAGIVQGRSECHEAGREKGDALHHAHRAGGKVFHALHVDQAECHQAKAAQRYGGINQSIAATHLRLSDPARNSVWNNCSHDTQAMLSL